MTKKHALENLDAARRSHIKWLNRAVSMLRGASSIRDPHPLESTACKFGLWFNYEGENLYRQLDIEGFTKVHFIHVKLHEKYLNIYEIYFGSAEGIIYNQKAILKKNIVSEELEKEAIEHMDDLKKLSYAMLQEIHNLQESIKESDTFS